MPNAATERTLSSMRNRLGVSVLLGCIALGCSDSERAPARGKPLVSKAAAQESAALTSSASSAVQTAVPATGAHGGPAPDPTDELLAMSGTLTKSIGAPANGRLDGAVELPKRGPGYYHNPKRPEQARFGTVETLQAIVRAAAVVEREMPGSTLTINDIGLREGGPIAQHGSHQSGRDADILFYMLDAKRKPIPAVGVPLDPTGQGVDFKDLAVPGDDQKVRIDLPRSWRFMQALLEESPGQVQRIFIVEHLRNMLLAEAQRVRAPQSTIQRFDEVTCQPGTPHDDHIHVRFFCTAEDLKGGCEDSAPLYPWRVNELAAVGLEPVLAATKRTPEERAARAARTTTAAEARRKAGPMHRNVVEFLKQREAWMKQPHPGRPYCK